MANLFLSSLTPHLKRGREKKEWKYCYNGENVVVCWLSYLFALSFLSNARRLTMSCAYLCRAIIVCVVDSASRYTKYKKNPLMLMRPLHSFQSLFITCLGRVAIHWTLVSGSFLNIRLNENNEPYLRSHTLRATQPTKAFHQEKFVSRTKELKRCDQREKDGSLATLTPLTLIVRDYSRCSFSAM